MFIKVLLALLAAAATGLEYTESLTAKSGPGGLAGWEVVSGNWTQNDGFLQGNSSGGDGLLFYKKRTFANFVLECKVKVVNREGSLVFRAADKQNLYILVFNPKVNPEDQGSVLLIRRVRGRETYFAGSEQYIGSNEWLTLKVSCEDRRIEVYVNNKLTVSVEDASHGSGFVGLRVFGDIFNGCNAQFKDFSIRTSEVEKK